jgi:hypothetical protein
MEMGINTSGLSASLSRSSSDLRQVSQELNRFAKRNVHILVPRWPRSDTPNPVSRCSITEPRPTSLHLLPLLAQPPRSHRRLDVHRSTPRASHALSHPLRLSPQLLTSGAPVQCTGRPLPPLSIGHVLGIRWSLADIRHVVLIFVLRFLLRIIHDPSSTP